MTNTKATYHGVLAGAYKGSRTSLQATLTHASGETAVCGKVAPGNLCDLEEAELTCAACRKKLKV